MPTIDAIATGISPEFTISAEEFLLHYFTTVSPVDIDGVKPPDLGAQGGASHAMDLTNDWFPWIDEKLVEPKFDGIGKFMGVMTNRPSYIKDYHFLTLMRACDRILAPAYLAYIKATVNPPGPNPPPTG